MILEFQYLSKTKNFTKIKYFFLAYIMVHNICHIICLLLLTAFLESDPRLHYFCKPSLSRESGSFLWNSEHAGYKEERDLSRKMYFSINPQQKVLSSFNFVPKAKEFLSKILPISRTFVKQKRYWTFNITQSLGKRRKFRSFLKLNLHLKIFWVIRVSNCCSASLPSVYLTI